MLSHVYECATNDERIAGRNPNHHSRNARRWDEPKRIYPFEKTFVIIDE
jgi:hypothetical protein